MAQVEKFILLIDDGPALVDASSQERIIKRMLDIPNSCTETLFLGFDQISSWDSLVQILKNRSASHLVCLKLTTIKKLVKNFLEFTKLLAYLKRDNIEFSTVQEGIHTEDALDVFLSKLVLGWETSISESKFENPKVSHLKARLRGSSLGRPRKRNDNLIGSLRAKGATIKEIAEKTGVSTTVVKRSLRVSRT